MIGAIIGAIIGGLIIGALARLVLPGKQDISMPMTIGIGMASSFVASLVIGVLPGHHGFLSFIGGVVVAVLAISWYTKCQISSSRR